MSNSTNFKNRILGRIQIEGEKGFLASITDRRILDEIFVQNPPQDSFESFFVGMKFIFEGKKYEIVDVTVLFHLRDVHDKIGGINAYLRGEEYTSNMDIRVAVKAI